MIKQRLLMNVLFSSLLALGACSGDKDPASPGGKKSAKFNITIGDVKLAEGDRITVQVVGGVSGSTEKTLWKLNGNVMNNEIGILLDEDDFAAGGTFVVESVVGLDVVALNINSINSGTPLTVNVTGKVGGKDIAAVNQTVTSDYFKQFNY